MTELFSGWRAAESYCGRSFDWDDMPVEVAAAIAKADIVGYFPIECQHLCDPYRVVLTGLA